MAEVLLKNVKKVYEGGVVAVHDFSLKVEDKEFVVLVGPSGCGKSTTLRMIAGLEEITEGEVYIADRLVNDVPPKDRDIAMVFQNYALYPHMTVYKNMEFGLKLRGFPKVEIDTRVREAAQILGLQDLLQRKPKQLSGGQRQRVAVGRAIVRKPKVFLFDEPLSNLDAKMRVQMRTEIAKLHTRLQATMIYVTHDQVEAMTMGDRIVVMKDGYAQQVADPLTLYEHPRNRFVAGFIGSPPMNFLDVRVVSDNSGVWVDMKAARLRVPDEAVRRLAPYLNKELTFGIRPEHIFDQSTVPTANPQRIVNALVDVIEPLGPETYLYLTAGQQSFVAKVSSYQQCEVGDTVCLVFDMDHAHFFDKATEAVI